MYINGKMRPVETIPEMQEEGIMIEEVNSTLLYCKKVCKYHNVPPLQQ
jgi:hypothetical protein